MWILWAIGGVIAILLLTGLVLLGRDGYVGPFKKLALKNALRHNQGKPKGQIVFYGASNFTLWKTLELDLLPFDAQNHGFGGSTDRDLMDCAQELLFPWEPRVIVFQSGSNDFAMQGLSLEQVFANKEKMFSMFRERLPNASFVVMSMLPLPGRRKYWPPSQKVNAWLEGYCAAHENMVFADATPTMMDGLSGFRPEYFSDGLHLNKAGRGAWIPIIKEALAKVTEPRGVLS